MTAIRGRRLGAVCADVGMVKAPARSATPAAQAGTIRLIFIGLPQGRNGSLASVLPVNSSVKTISVSRSRGFPFLHRQEVCSGGQPVLTFESVPWYVRSTSVPVLLVQTAGQFSGWHGLA